MGDNSDRNGSDNNGNSTNQSKTQRPLRPPQTKQKVTLTTSKTARKGTATKTSKPTTTKKLVPVVTAARKASTPTKDDVTFSDQTLDASCISIRSVLETSIVAPPRMKLSSNIKVNERNKTPTTRPKFNQSLSHVRNTANGKNVSSRDTTTVNDGLDIAYTRSLQVFMATEDLRQKVIKKEKENATWKALCQVDRSLDLVKSYLSPAMKVLVEAEQQLGSLPGGLNRIRHHLHVEGIVLEDSQKAQDEIENLCSLLKEFGIKTKHYQALITDRGPAVQAMASKLNIVTDLLLKCDHLVKDCQKLMEQTESVVTQEASLAHSLHQLKM